MVTFQFARRGSQWKPIYLVNPMANNESSQQVVERRAGSVEARYAIQSWRKHGGLPLGILLLHRQNGPTSYDRGCLPRPQDEVNQREVASASFCCLAEDST